VDVAIPLTSPPSPPSPPPRRRWRRVHTLVLLALVLLGVFAGTFITIPYYALAPGSAIDVRPLVDVEDGPSFPPEGGVYLTTVSLYPVGLFEALQGWLDPETDVVEREKIAPRGVGPDELRRANLALMDESKDAARGVAFEELGFDAISGTGASIASVQPGTPADGALSEGDTIVAVDGEEVAVAGDAVRLLGEHAPGDEVAVGFERRGEGRTATVVLGENPEIPGRPFLGVSLGTRDLELDFPYEVDIDSERIGGPSAGLAFALGLLDLLTEGELTGGEPVAATGSIELDGTVGPVGGVAQKAAAVEAEGIDLFFVPAQTAEEARRFVGDGLRVEPVETLDDALRVLTDRGGEGVALGRGGPGA
jgi:Lon-like protease